VLDSGSRDGTLEIARKYGAQVFEHPFETHAQQWTWALHHLPIAHEWILGLDADQQITAELREELAALFASPDVLRDVNGFFIKRRQIFRKVWIRHGGYYPKYLLKLFRRSRVQLDANELAEHHFYVDGATRRLQSDLIEDNRKEHDLAFWMQKHIRYAALQAQDEAARRQRSSAWLIRPALFGNPDQRVLWLRERWYRSPLFVRPFLYFVYRYIFLLGFLDGKQGLVFHFLQSLWFRLLVDVYLDEALTNARNPTAPTVPHAPTQH
jgi:glycosyltransferase involved in cell wall biosynthesis